MGGRKQAPKKSMRVPGSDTTYQVSPFVQKTYEMVNVRYM